MKIIQIEESEVIKKICADVNVFRLKVDECSICNLQDKSIKTIKRDMQKEDVKYLYFVLKDEKENEHDGEQNSNRHFRSNEKTIFTTNKRYS